MVAVSKDTPLCRRGSRALVLSLACALMVSGPLSAQDAASQPVLNRFCPVMPDEEVDPSITTTYDGRTIAFCCDNCLARFNANPERYLDRLASLGVNGDQPPSGGTEETHVADTHDHEHEAGETSASDEVDGGHAHEAGQERPPLLARVHPIIVHFPVAGIPLALLGFLAWLVSRRQIFAAADVPPLVLAATATIAAVITGNTAHGSMRSASSLHDYVHWHQYFGTAVMILALVLTALRLWRWNTLTGPWLPVYAGGLGLASLLVGLTGYLGGSLVYGPDHLAW